MPLVDYSESEGSDQEEAPTVQEPAKDKPSPNKPIFQKVVDRSNPHKIKVSLPETAKPTTEDGNQDSERPAKRARVDRGGLSGFNAFLPAPKRAAAPNGGSLANGGRKGGLGSGVNLRTGAAPGFSRECEPSIGSTEEGVSGEDAHMAAPAVHMNTEANIPVEEGVRSLEKPVEEPKLKGKTTMFKPLSVARKPQKTKLYPTDSISGQSAESVQQPTPVSKISLFSAGKMTEMSTSRTETNGSYQPMMYSVRESKPTETLPDAEYEGNPADEQYTTTNDTKAIDQAPQSLDTIASDLNLSASAKRQLLGRQKHNSSAINIVNFNTDEEYKQNELMRQAGEVVQHNAVRAIAPGKHSLKQLVNAASTQKDALEESFASGRRNKKEAGSKYGW